MSATNKVQPVLCCLLAILQASVVFVLGLASVNPDIHLALHADKACPHNNHCHSHGEESGNDSESGAACPVVLYGEGLVLGPALELPSRLRYTEESRQFVYVVVHLERTPLTQRSRAPPTVLFA